MHHRELRSARARRPDGQQPPDGHHGLLPHVLDRDPSRYTSTSFETRVGKASAISAPMNPPMDFPTTIGDSLQMRTERIDHPRRSSWIEILPLGISERPNPGRSGATTR